MNREEFGQLIRKKRLLLDGAMGTVLHSRGIPIDGCFDALNIEDPQLVGSIHREYIEVGADIIETNTFGANRYKLDSHGCEVEVHSINQAAVRLARRIIADSNRPVLLAGAVGPLGVRIAPLGRVKLKDARAAFEEQISALTSPPGLGDGGDGVDIIILETIPDLQEMTAAVRAARRVAPDIPIISNMTFTRDDRSILGDTPSAVAAYLADLDVDAIGVNCSSGPVQVLRLIAAYREMAPHVPLVAVPNAGWPQQEEGGRVYYPATPDYFARYTQAFINAGARAVGGCCGTTAEHIAAMRQALDRPILDDEAIPRISIKRPPERGQMAADGPTEFDKALANNRFVVTVEMGPPKGIAAQKLLTGAKMLKEAGAEFINVTDSPLARMRMSAWAAAYLVQKEVDLEAVLHFPTRGRNLLRIQGDLLAAHSLGVRNLLVVMGDPTQIGDYPEATDNYDIVPTGLIRLITQKLNVGLDQSGQRIDQPTSFTVGCALNLEPPNVDHELRLLRKKVVNGAKYALTQPVFNPAAAKKFIKRYQKSYNEPIIPVIAGIQPLYNSGNAEFLHNEAPGINIPVQLRKRMVGAKNPQTEGVAIAQEIIEEMGTVIQGIYLIPVFGRFDIVADIIEMQGRPL
ncbi:MAG: bifunctional homocysteine S-methyltransferase/methylenetetrahydrofolate reductase [Anaerolineae bacterium]|nr:MAG: bifunctional homocysteine S-methyltransferase/methylenetetrahydrofolate reductase [Anaerolineae bacterium]